MKMKSSVGWVKVVLFATVVMYLIAYAAPRGEPGIYSYGVIRDRKNNTPRISDGVRHWKNNKPGISDRVRDWKKNAAGISDGVRDWISNKPGISDGVRDWINNKPGISDGVRDWINNKPGISFADWIDKGLDFVYGDKNSGIPANGKYSNGERMFFVFGGVIGGTILLIIILVSCCCVCCYFCCRSTNGRNSPAISVLPGNGNYSVGYGHGCP